MLTQNIFAVLSILTLALPVSARPFANSTFVARQILGAVNDLPVTEILPINNLPVDVSDIPLDNLPLNQLPPVSVPVTIPTEIAAGNSGQNAGGSSSNSGTIGSDMTVGQAADTCGSSQLNCCNEISNSGDTTNSGVLTSIFGSGGIGIQCSPISLPVIGSIDHLPPLSKSPQF